MIIRILQARQYYALIVLLEISEMCFSKCRGLRCCRKGQKLEEFWVERQMHTNDAVTRSLGTRIVGVRVRYVGTRVSEQSRLIKRAPKSN
jgi:hypothetical protein